MEKNEIKKVLLKTKPKAKLNLIRKGSAYYSTIIEGGKEILFEVPVNDMGDADYFVEMESQLLLRYIV